MSVVITLNNPSIYSNVYTLSGFSQNKSIILTNHTSNTLFIEQSSTQPSSSEGGFPVYSKQTVLIQGTNQGIWIKGGLGPVVVQDYTDTIIPFNSIDPRVYAGTQGLTIQPFTEANCKNGVQFETSSYLASLGANQSTYAIFRTTSKFALLKNRQISYTGKGVTADVFINPTFTGGTTLPAYNLRLDSFAQAQTVQILSGITLGSLGTQIAASTVGIGTAGQGSNTVGTFSGFGQQGIERVIPPNTTLLLRITNRDTVACELSTYATWYEGPLSVTI